MFFKITYLLPSSSYNSTSHNCLILKFSRKKKKKEEKKAQAQYDNVTFYHYGDNIPPPPPVRTATYADMIPKTRQHHMGQFLCLRMYNILCI